MALYAEDEEYDLDGEESVMLDEELDENYEPTEDEIIEYAQFLGMDLNEDQDLLYIAKEGLKAPLPENYKPYRRRTGEIVYIDLRTNEFQEEHPCDEYYRNLYQEMKRKKAQRRTESKFKKNFPLGNKSSSPAKTEALPSFQTSSAQKKVPEKNILDKSMGSDHHDSLTSSVNDTSFNQMPGPLINKDNKKKAFGSNLQNSDMRVSLGASEGDGGYDNIDQDFEDRFFDYYKEREQEFNLSKKKLKEKEETQDQELKQKLEKEKKELKDKLKVQGEASRTKLAKDKDVWRKELQIESDANLEEEIKKEDKQHFANKRELDKSLAKKLEDDLKDEEGKIEKEFQKKKEDLLEKKRDIQAEIEHVKQIEAEREKKEAQSLEDEKEYIIKGFNNQLREFEVQERVKQENEIHQYQKEIKNKLEEERKMLAVAKAQKQTLIASKKDELKEYYDRKLISEQERIDIQLVEDLKKYDEKEKIIRDGEIQKTQQTELKQQRDKKQMQFQTELNQLEDNYKKRLTNYQQLLREKFEKETSVLEEEAKKALGSKQKEIENIKIDVSNKDDMLREISRVQANENQLTQQIQEYEAKMEKQKDENFALQKKLESLKTKKQTMQTNNNHTIEKLKQEIKEKDKEIDRLFNSKRGIKDKYYHAGEKSYAKQRPTALDQSNTSLNKIRQDVREIKSFITLKDVVGHSHSFSKGFHNDSHTNAPSRTMLHSNVTDKREGASKKLRFTQGKTVEDWITTYHNETGKIEQQKKELKKEKISIKKAQEYLQDEQFRYKEEYSDLRLSPNKSFEKKSALKKAKMSLNDQVKRLNDDVYRLRETELLLKNKEKLLSTIGNMIRKMSIKDFDPEELEILYKEYQELDSESKQLVGKQHKRTDTTFSHDEPPEFYKRWESILENQLSLDVDTSVEEAKFLKENRKQQYNFSEVVVERPLRPEIREEISEDLTEPQSTKNADYSYQNLIKVLDLKLRSGVRGPENDYARRQRNLSTEHRYKMNAVFSEHSEWLKDMRTQLNRQLYDRPQSASTLVASRY